LFTVRQSTGDPSLIDIELAMYPLPAFVAALLVVEGSAWTRRHSDRRFFGARSIPDVYKNCLGIDCFKAYIAEPDPAYHWYNTGVQFRGEESSVGWTAHVLNMTSQRWLSEAVISNPEWWHVVVAVIPDNLNNPDWLTMIIESGINHEDIAFAEHISPREPPDEVDGISYKGQTFHSHLTITSTNILDRVPKLREGIYKAAHIATHTGALAASLFSSLNDWEIFTSDERHLHRTDDAIKSYTWVEFLRNNGDDARRVMELPLAKAALRCIDTLQNFTKGLPSGMVSRFGVTGYSKYGSGTWTLGALGDPRIHAIAPSALPLQFVSPPPLNLLQQPEQIGTNYEGRNPVTDFETHFQNFMLSADLEDKNPSYDLYTVLLLKELAAGHFDLAERITSLTEPGYYSQHIRVPTFFVMTIQDAWFDKSTLKVADWWPKLDAPKSLLFVPTEHENAITFRGGLEPITAYFLKQIRCQPMPMISYAQQGDSVTVSQLSEDEPIEVRLNYARANCKDNSLLRSTFYRGPNLTASKVRQKLVWNATVAEARQFLQTRSTSTQTCPLAAYVTAEYEGLGDDHIRLSSPLYLFSG